MGRAKKPYLGFLFRCYSDPAFKESFALTLDQTIPAGEYPINVLIGRRDDGDQRCMGMQVTFSSASEQILKPAWPKSERGRWLKSRQLPHFGVDSATAGVFSVDVADKIAALPHEQLMEGRTEVNPYLSKNEESLWMRVTIEGKCRGIIAFSGLGDGAYHAYFSYDTQGNPVALYVDFGFFPPPAWDWHCQPEPR